MKHESFGPVFRLSYVSEPGERLSDLGGGKVLIRHNGRCDRVLDRRTGIIEERATMAAWKIWMLAALLLLGVAGCGLTFWVLVHY